MGQIGRVAIIGTGNVANHLAVAFQEAGLHVEQVYGRRLEFAARLASRVGSDATDELSSLTRDADLYLVALSDDALPWLAAAFPYSNKLLVHTSGTLGMEVFARAGPRHGVFYPLQTLSSEVKIDFSEVPLLLEAANDQDYKLLDELAGKLSRRVMWADSGQRRLLHVSAVFACNFANHMYAVAAELMESGNLPFDLLKPLIKETARKVMETPPSAAQTGPALRNNRQVMDAHLNMLTHKPVYRDIYQLISESIIQSFNQKNQNH